MAGPQLKVDDAGNVWDVSSGAPVFVHGARAGPQVVMPAAPNPTEPYKGPQAAADLTRTRQEIAAANATAASNAIKAKADAQSAQIDARTKQETYDAAHPKTKATNGLTGPEFLATLPANKASLIKALDDGRLAFPGGFALKTPFFQDLLQGVAQYDPAFDATNFNARAKARASVIGGKLGGQAGALNTAMAHAGQLYDQASGPSGVDIPHAEWLAKLANHVANSWNTGSIPLTNYESTQEHLTPEEASAYGIGTAGERGSLGQPLSEDNPLPTKESAIRNAISLFAGKQQALLHQYSAAGAKPTWDLLSPAAKAVLDKFPDIRDKYFDSPDIDPKALALFHQSGGALPPGPPSAAPQADYSGMAGGGNQTLAAGGYRNEYDPVMASALSGFIRNGTPYETAASFLQSHGLVPPRPADYAAGVSFAQAHHGATNVEASRNVPTTMTERLASSPLAAGLAGGATAASGGLDDVVGRHLAGPAWDANRAALALTNPGADLAGNVIGGAAGMIGAGGIAGNALRAGAKGGLARDALALALKNPVKAGIAGDTAYGATYGASENPDNPISGALTGAAGGMFGGALGAAGSKVVGKTMAGVVNPAAQRLRDAGIPLTVGEVFGGGAKKAQDALTSVFGPGNMVARRYEDSRTALNQAAFNQAGQIIGAPISDVGQAGIQSLSAAKNKAYSSALDPVSINLATPETIGGLKGAIGSANAIPNVDQARDIATGSLEDYIGNAAPSGIMSGPDFQAAYRGLSRTSAKSAPRIYGDKIGNALGQGQDALVGALQDQNPGAYDAFLRANSANRHLSVLTDAVNAAKNQIGSNGEPLFTPAQLGMAASNNARTYGGKVAAASGNRPFNQLATDAQQVMSSKLPESGTFPRALLAGALMGGGGMFGNNTDGGQGAAEGALAPLGLLTLLGTRGGQKFLTKALMDRPQAIRLAGQQIAARPQVGSGILAAAGIPLLTSPYGQ